MLTLNKSKVTYFDVDDTLIYWNWPKTNEQQTITLYPHSDKEPITFAVNSEMVEQLKKHWARKHAIVVWSQGGWQWAEQVVKALNLQDYVDLVIEKPSWLYDDLPAKAFMPKSLWVGNKELLK